MLVGKQSSTFANVSDKERETRYREALRYFENAREILRSKARKKDRYYEDGKYVRMACGTAYSGVLKALDVYLNLKGKPIHRKKYARKIGRAHV